jgi:hypothetical protein
MKEGLKFWSGKRRWGQPPLGLHELNKPELCFPGELDGHGQIEQTPQDQEIVLFQPEITDVPAGKGHRR